MIRLEARPQLDPNQIKKDFELANSKVDEALKTRASKGQHSQLQKLKIWVLLLSITVALETVLLAWTIAQR